MSISVVYFSSSGNTQEMADAIASGIAKAGQSANVIDVADASVSKVCEESAFALGCSAMGDEELDDAYMEPFVSELEGKVSGKKVLLFGSYGWGDGEWMRSWCERMANAGAVLIEPEGVICCEAPDDEATAACEAAGRKLAESI